MISLFRRLFRTTSPRPKTRAAKRTSLTLEHLEQREVMSISSMTQLAEMFPPHEGPTMLYLNFDGTGSGPVAGKSISPYTAGPSGDRNADIYNIFNGVSRLFASFNVEVRQIYGAGAYDSGSNGNTTIFIGANAGNISSDTHKKVPGSGTPSQYVDAPGVNKGYNHVPNSDPYDLAFVDPVGQDATGKWITTQSVATIVQAIGHEAGHTFGLEHVFTGDGSGKYSASNPGDMMTYDAPNASFIDMNYSVTDANYDPTLPAPLPGYAWNVAHAGDSFFAEWKESNGTIDKITLQDSYTYLHAVLGRSTNQVAVGTNANGLLQTFAIGSDNSVQTRTQLSGGGWSAWSSLGGFVEQITVNRDTDGRLELFVVGSDNAVYSKYQFSPNSNSWSDWYSLGGTVKQIKVGMDANGHEEVFAIGTDDRVYHQYQLAIDGGWSGWQQLGGWQMRQIEVSKNADGRLEVFGIGQDNSLCHIWQVAPNSGWSNWESRGGYVRQISVGMNAGGYLEVFAIGSDDGVYHMWQGPGGWSGWDSLRDIYNTQEFGVQQITVGRNAAGGLEVFVISTFGSVIHISQGPSGWGQWSYELDGSVQARDLTAAINSDGRVELFAVGSDNALYNVWQVAPNGGWSGWNSLGGWVM
jgi:hypothetical protein